MCPFIPHLYPFIPYLYPFIPYLYPFIPKLVLQIVRHKASFFNYQYHLVSSRSSSSYLRFFLVFPGTSILPSIFPSIKYFKRQFLNKIWPIQLAFLIFTVCRIFLSHLTPDSISSFSTQSAQLISVLLQRRISKLSRYFRSNFRTVPVSAPYKATLQMQHFMGFFLKHILLIWHIILTYLSFNYLLLRTFYPFLASIFIIPLFTFIYFFLLLFVSTATPSLHSPSFVPHIFNIPPFLVIILIQIIFLLLCFPLLLSSSILYINSQSSLRYILLFNYFSINYFVVFLAVVTSFNPFCIDTLFQHSPFQFQLPTQQRLPSQCSLHPVG